MTSLFTNRFIRPQWMDWGACAGTDSPDFFSARQKEIEAAKAVCSGCAVEDLCLQYALDEEIVFGVWGRTSEAERKAMKNGPPPPA